MPWCAALVDFSVLACNFFLTPYLCTCNFVNVYFARYVIMYTCTRMLPYYVIATQSVKESLAAVYGSLYCTSSDCALYLNECWSDARKFYLFHACDFCSSFARAFGSTNS